jgi:PAS domain-containing protein
MSGYDTVAFDPALARAGDGVFIVGGEGRVQLWNSAAQKIRGCSKPGRRIWLPRPA